MVRFLASANDYPWMNIQRTIVVQGYRVSHSLQLAFFKHNPKKGGNTEVNLHPYGTHIQTLQESNWLQE